MNEAQEKARAYLRAEGPTGDDEADVIAFYERERMFIKPWAELEDWQQASWRIEYREEK